MVNYVFDVDGTLTPSCEAMDPGFKEFFRGWMRHKDVYLLTGSDSEKTINQVGRDVWSNLISYQCSGNEIYAFGKKVYELKWPLNEGKLLACLTEAMAMSRYPDRFGTHIEVRKGMINFSTIGRGCDQVNRKKYFKWDKKNKERELVCELIMTSFPHVEAAVGGEISIDIYPKGRNKGQVYDYLYNTCQPIYFFGDKTEPGGNDHSIARRLYPPHKVFQVSGPDETLSILRNLN